MRRNNNYWYENPSGHSGIDLGFGPQYDKYEQHQTQRVQILAPKSLPPDKIIHYCSTCNKPLQWLQTNKKWICYTDQITYNSLYDSPLTSIDQQIRPLQGEHSEKPILISLSPDRRLQGENKYANGIKDVQISGNGRTIKVKTTNLAAASEESIRKYLKEDGYGQF